MESHMFSLPTPVSGDGGSGSPTWTVDVIRLAGDVVVGTLIVNNETLPPRNKKKKVIWKLPDCIEETPKFGEHEKKRLWEIFKQQKKERRKNLKQQPKGGSDASSTSPPPSTNGTCTSKTSSSSDPSIASLPDERRPPDNDDKPDHGLNHKSTGNHSCNATTVTSQLSESAPLHPAPPPGISPNNHHAAPPPGFTGTDRHAEQLPFLFNQIAPSDDDNLLSLGPAVVELFGTPSWPTYYTPHATLTILYASAQAVTCTPADRAAAAANFGPWTVRGWTLNALPPSPNSRSSVLLVLTGITQQMRQQQWMVFTTSLVVSRQNDGLGYAVEQDVTTLFAIGG